MGIKFIGTPIKQFDQLCSEEEIVMIKIETFKTEEIGYHNDDGTTTYKKEDVQTGGWGRQIFSWKDIFQIDDEDDYPDKKNIRDSLREKMR